MTDDIEVRIAKVIAKQGSDDFTTPSGPTLTLMVELLDEGDLQGYAQLYIAFVQAYRHNLPYVSGLIPAQIRNFLIKHRDIDILSLEAWATDNSGWEGELRDTLRNPPMFEAKVKAITDEIKNRGT